MTIELKELLEIIGVFGPGVVALFLLSGLLIKIAKDLLSRQRT